MDSKFTSTVTIPLDEYNTLLKLRETFEKNKKVYCTGWDYRSIHTMNESETVAMIGELLIKSTNENYDLRKKVYDLEQALKPRL